MTTLDKFIGALVLASVFGLLIFYFWFTTVFNFFSDDWLSVVYFLIGVSVLFGLVMAPIFVLLGRDRLVLMLFALAFAFLVFQLVYLVYYISLYGNFFSSWPSGTVDGNRLPGILSWCTSSGWGCWRKTSCMKYTPWRE